MADATAFEAFYRKNVARIARACALVLLDRSAAEDVTAEAFARLWSKWDQVESEDHAGGFVFKTAMRLCAREWRGRSRRPPLSEGQADPIESALARHDVALALQDLPLRQRQAVVLRDWAGFPTNEVARLLRMRESTVRVHLARGRNRLRQALFVEEHT
jgi:RNA polymerase sigma factor (sigma-70 family)